MILTSDTSRSNLDAGFAARSGGGGGGDEMILTDDRSRANLDAGFAGIGGGGRSWILTDDTSRSSLDCGFVACDAGGVQGIHDWVLRDADRSRSNLDAGFFAAGDGCGAILTDHDNSLLAPPKLALSAAPSATCSCSDSVSHGLQLQQGFSTGIAAVGHANLCVDAARTRVGLSAHAGCWCLQPGS